jgi:putative oxidoreductase
MAVYILQLSLQFFTLVSVPGQAGALASDQVIKLKQNVMLRKFLSSKVISENGLALIRMMAGMLILVHGFGLFHQGHMEGNVAWLTDLHFPAPVFMAYLGKGAEFIGGIFLVLGLLARFTAVVLMINMAVITFVMGSGRIFSEDEQPWLLLILFLWIFFNGAGKWSLDRLLFDKQLKQESPDA